MNTQLKMCLFGHVWETQVFSTSGNEFEKGTQIKVYKCKNCPKVTVFAYPPKGDRYILETSWAKKHFGLES